MTPTWHNFKIINNAQEKAEEKKFADALQILNDLLKQLEGKSHAVNVVEIVKRLIKQYESERKFICYHLAEINHFGFPLSI